MNIVREYGTRPSWVKVLVFFSLVTAGIGINLLGANIVAHYELPLYLDCIGTILASMLGGYMQGIVVGLFSSIINGFIGDPQLVSYGVLNVFIALFTSWAASHKWFKNPAKIILSVFILAFIGGVLGAFLTLYIYGFASGTVAGPAVFWYSKFGMSTFAAEVMGDFSIDILDKAISIAISVAIYYLIPFKYRRQFRIHSWKQAPLSSEAMSVLKHNNTRGHSLRYKIIFLLTFVSTLVAVTSVAISYMLYRKSMESIAEQAGLSPSEFNIEQFSDKFLVNQLSLFIGIFILIVAMCLYIARYHVVLPLNAMAYTVGYFSEEDRQSMKEMVEVFDKLRIDTGDETETLYYNISEMIKQNMDYLDDIQSKNATISEMQNALIIVLADLVESRDHSTGDHIKSTAEYVELIIDAMLELNIYRNQLTPKFISDVYQSAPLHDIGKISVSDVILNKPGKLTDEEFTIMKRHSQAGAEIIDRVISTLPNSDGGYLHEARNLALYHHEKWDGSGYPYGIKGEEIPLSARIMAVADVFDALVSTRSYKKPFTFEKAIEIIEESSGSHFDPLIVKAFLSSKDKIRLIAEEKD